MNAATTVAEEIVRNVDRLIAPRRNKSGAKAADSLSVIPDTRITATCSCGSGIPVTVLPIAGHSVEVLALPIIFDQFRLSGKAPGAATGIEMMETVRLYNSVPADEQAAWREVIDREYAAYFGQEAR
jgi:hypothetical protein